MKRKMFFLVVLFLVTAFSFNSAKSQTLSQVAIPTGCTYYASSVIYNSNLYVKLYNGSKFVMAKFDGTSFTIISNPAGMTNYQGQGIVYNSKFYVQYRNASGNYQLYEFDGTTFTNIPNPAGMKSYNGQGIVYNSKLYLQYYDFTANGHLYVFDGTTLTSIPTPAGMASYNANGIIYNSKLYLQYMDNFTNTVLYEFDGTTLTAISNPAGTVSYLANGIIYNSKLYLQYMDNSWYNVLCEFDGTTLTAISNPAGTVNYNANGIVYNSKLYLQYTDASSNNLLYEFDGTTLTAISNPAGVAYNANGIVYNSKLYLQYTDASANGYLYEFDGTTLTNILNPAGMPNYYAQGIIYNSKLYLQYLDASWEAYMYEYSIASSATTWNGSAWDNGVPTATVDAIIDGLYDETTNIVCKDLTINAGKNLEVQPSYSVTVNGNLINNGTLKLVSPATLAASGSLITLGTITNNGTMEADRKINADQYHLMASPLNASISANLPFNMDYVWTYLEGYSGSENDYAWSQLTAQGSTIAPKVGYLVKSSSSFAANSNLVIPFIGTFNTGDQTAVSLPFTYQGYNLIGNPYPSALNWDDASLVKTNIDNSIWIWNNSVYEVYDGVVGNADTRNGFIPAMQGFFVKANTGGGSLTFKNAARVHNTTSFSKNEVPNLISLTTSGNDLSDAVALYFYSDNADSKKFMTSTSEVPQIYAIENNESLAIDRLQNVNAQQDVNLGFVCDIAGNYTITANEFTFNNETSIVLEDLKTGTLTSLSKDKSYSFAYEVGEAENRFVLHFNYVATSIDEVSDINIFANAKSIYFNNIDNQIGTVKVYNVLGQTVLTSDLKSVIETNLNTGVYVVEVVTNNNKITKQIIIN